MVEPSRQFLYHASNNDFTSGDVVKPINYNHAFATTDESLAKEYGKNVYRVEPVDKEESDSYTASEAARWVGEMSKDAKSVVISQKGFKIIDKDEK